MLLTLHPNWWEDWELYHKVTFDGENKLIIINPDVDTINIKQDVYSNWKEWMLLRDNSKFLAAIRVSGGDPIGGGQFTGDVYFLINGWKIRVDHSCTIDGVIYSDDYPSPFVPISGTQIVTNKVAALVSVVATESIGGITVPTASENALAVWSAANKELSTSGNTAIVASMDANSVKLAQIKAILDSMEVPTAVENATAVWSKPVSTLTDKTTIGGYISKVLLSIPKFLGLK